jgi:hypothetical protein
MTYLGLLDAIYLLVGLLMYLGWLYFPYRHATDDVPVSSFWSLGKVAAILVALSIYGLILFLDWNPSYKALLSRPPALFGYGGYSYLARKMWPMLGVPLWALAIVLFPHVIRRRLGPKPSFIEPMPDSLFALPGWILFAYSYFSLLVYLDL